jgi:hypothetical protein
MAAGADDNRFSGRGRLFCAHASGPSRSAIAMQQSRGMPIMTDNLYTRALEEFGRLLNDPDMPIQPEQVWNLLDQIIKAGYKPRDRLSRGGAARLRA